MGEEDFVSLSDEQVQRYSDLYSNQAVLTVSLDKQREVQKRIDTEYQQTNPEAETPGKTDAPILTTARPLQPEQERWITHGRAHRKKSPER